MTDGCPHCGAGELELEAGGTVQRCRACGRSALRATSGGGVAGTAGEGATHSAGFAVEAPRLEGAFAGGGRTAAAPGEVAVLPAAGFAFVATLLFYGALRFVPETRLSELFVERGWVPYAISFVSAWALALLAAKRVRLGRERRLLERGLARAPGRPARDRPERRRCRVGGSRDPAALPSRRLPRAPHRARASAFPGPTSGRRGRRVPRRRIPFRREPDRRELRAHPGLHLGGPDPGLHRHP
jgi:hypothetical protein